MFVDIVKFSFSLEILLIIAFTHNKCYDYVAGWEIKSAIVIGNFDLCIMTISQRTLLWICILFSLFLSGSLDKDRALILIFPFHSKLLLWRRCSDSIGSVVLNFLLEEEKISSWQFYFKGGEIPKRMCLWNANSNQIFTISNQDDHKELCGKVGRRRLWCGV